MILIILSVQIVEATGVFINKDVYAENDLQIVDTQYNALLNELQLILNEKNFGNEINEIIIDGMKSLWDSYDNIYFSYSAIGYPSKEQYIRDNYIKAIEMVGYIRLLSEEEIAFQPGVVAYASKDENEVHYVCLQHKPTSEDEYKEYLNTLQHEIRHVVQNENWNGKASEDYFYMLRASSEGWAVLGELNKYKSNEGINFKNIHYCESKIDEQNNYVQIGGIGSVTEYCILANTILKLTIIVGYDNMYKFETGVITYEELLEIVYQKLGTETANRFIDDLKTDFLNYSKDYSVSGWEGFWYNEDVNYDKIFDAENIVLEVLKNKISNANSKEEIQALFNFYYVYKKYYCVKYQEIIEKVIEETENGSVKERKKTDKSSEKLNLDIEDILIEKAIQYKAVNTISNNTKLNKMALRSLFAEPDIPSLYSGYISLENDNYVYEENEKDGMLTGSLTTSGMKTTFNENDILSCEFLNYNEVLYSSNKLMKNTTNIDNNENADESSKLVNTIGETWTSTSNIGVRIKDSKLEVENLDSKENYYYYFWIVDDDKDLLPEGKEFYPTTAQINSISLVNIGDDLSYWLEENDVKKLKCQLVEEDTQHDAVSRVIINNVGLEEIINGKKKENDMNNDKEIEDKSNEDKKSTFSYKIIEGANQIYKGKGNLIIKSNGDIKKFVKLEIDDKDVSKDYYSLKSGSTIIELKETFLANLNKGKHEITFVYEDGKVSTKFEIVNDTKDGTQAKISLPQTGDKIGLILVIAIISAGVFVITRKRKEI